MPSEMNRVGERVPPESFWANQAERFNREWRMVPYESPDLGVTAVRPVRRQNESPPDRTDAIEVTPRWYANYQRPVYNAVFTIPGEQPSREESTRPAFDEAWIRANESGHYYDDCWRNGVCGPCSDIREEAARKYDEMYLNRPKFWPLFARLWYNLALAHTAAIFMLEVNWNGEKFTNEQRILEYLPSPADGAESGGGR